MSIALRRPARLALPLAVAFVCIVIASAASAQQQICIETDETPPVVFHLNVTFPGNNTVSIVGTEDQGAEHRVVTGGGALVGGQAELSFVATDIAAPPLGGTPTLVGTSTHVILNGPTFTTGTFKAARVRGLAPPTLSEGPAFVVDCASKPL